MINYLIESTALSIFSLLLCLVFYLLFYPFGLPIEAFYGWLAGCLICVWVLRPILEALIT